MAMASSTRAFMATKTFQDARVPLVEKRKSPRRRRVRGASHRATQDASRRSTDVEAQVRVSPKDGASWNRRTWMHASLVAWCVGCHVWATESVAEELTTKQMEEETPTCQVKRVFVAGSTGQSGQRIVRQLQQRGIQVRAGARNVKKANQILSNATEGGAGVEVVQADVTWDVERLRQAIGEVDAVVCATGFRPSPDINGVFKVENLGTKNLVDASKAAGVCKFVLISSLLTNAPAVGQKDNPNYKFLNYFGGVLDQKKQAEDCLRASGLNYTIVRAGGLTNDPSYSSGLYVSPEDTLFGLEQEPGREICRDLLASICIEALFQNKATNKVVEVVATGNADPPKQKWFDV